MTDRYEKIRKALALLDSGDYCERAIGYSKLRNACDPDTIRELLAERDLLLGAARIAATMCLADWLNAGGTVADFDRIAAIAAANGGTNG